VARPPRDGTSVFVKAGENDELVLRTIAAEIVVYESVRGPFLPQAYDTYARTAPVLAEADVRVPRSGDGLVPNDLWAENLCFARGGAVRVDWAEARI